MNTIQKELSQELSSSNGQHKSNSSENLGMKPIEGTPFYIVRDEDKHRVTLGKYVVSKAYDYEYDAEQAIIDRDWEIIMNIIGLVANQAIATNEGITLEALLENQ